ncbi:YafY family transcriptional regulator [Moheibacter sp. BDHS18]|uniref:YafY family transcriptional regulator n=2 Tax=Moheibacter lacus TaxID=2745851 RepID=A0A838ZTA8_9FLAO|nr:YafY family transcriptional regulator [Moheibacter lacus]
MYPDESPKRFDRIVAILIQLQSKKIVKAQELADRFEVSLRTIYRDIRSLESSGVPIYSEAGVGYSLVDGYKLPPVMFTKEEAGSFVAAEKLMQKFTDGNFGKHFESAMFKIKSVLRGSEKDWIESLESNIRLSSRDEAFTTQSPKVLELLFQSIAEKNQIVLHYQSVEADEISVRVIEPVGLYHEGQYWYILAYCHLRKDYRNFRTDRVVDLTSTQNSFELQHRELEYFLQPKEKNSTTKIRLLVDRKIARYIQNDRKFYGFKSETKKKDKVEMLFECNFKENGFARWLLMFGDYVEILEPEELKSDAVQLIKKIEKNLS